MRASNRVYVGGPLLAVSILMGGPAAAMEAAQAQGSTSSSAWSLPSFFDGARVPDLQEAWRSRDSAPVSAAPPAAEGTATAVPSSDDATLAAAKAAMTRAEQAGREAAAVRQKAEELSGRFGNDSAPATTGEVGAAAATDTAPDTATGSVEPRAPLPPPSALGAPPPADPETTAAAPETTAPGKVEAEAKPDEPSPSAAAAPNASKPRGTVTQDGRSTPDRHKSASPAAPPRSKTAASEPAPVPASTRGSNTTPGPKGKADTVPASMGSFGWDSQPQ